MYDHKIFKLTCSVIFIKVKIVDIDEKVERKKEKKECVFLCELAGRFGKFYEKQKILEFSVIFSFQLEGKAIS